MQPGIELISVFTKATEEDGVEYFQGTLSPSFFKKARKDVEVVLMPGTAIPGSIMDLFKRAGTGKADLLMFGVAGEEAKKAKGR